MTPEPRYTITVTQTQLVYIRDACELLSRLHIGQLEHVEEKIHGLPHEVRRELRNALLKINPMVTGLDYVHASRAPNEQTRLAHNIAWGLYHGIRYPLYLERCAELGEQPDPITVLSRPPSPEGGQPVPEVVRL